MVNQHEIDLIIKNRKQKAAVYSKKYRIKNKYKLNKYKREWVKKWRKEHPQEARNQYKKHGQIYKNKYPEKTKEIAALAIKKWRINNPERNKAHRIVFTELRAGRLLRKPCEFCGKGPVQAHHENYLEPLEIIWVCKIHHVLLDKRRRINETKTKETTKE